MKLPEEIFGRFSRRALLRGTGALAGTVGAAWIVAPIDRIGAQETPPAGTPSRPAPAGGGPTTGPSPGEVRAPLDAERRSAVIDGLLRLLVANYVFPELAVEMEQDIRGRQAAGEYEALTDPGELAETLTEHLQAVSHDKHLRVLYSPEPALPMTGDPKDLDAIRAEMEAIDRLHNFGFVCVERLPGNVGYLDLRAFSPNEAVGDVMAAALNLLTNTEALIVDVTRNGGGSPLTVALLCSYLLGPDPVHLVDVSWRGEDRTEEFWTQREVAGRRYGDKPVFVLTSGDTFSAAEEFAYDLQALKRATLVGETTAGAANPTKFFPIDDHFAASIPSGLVTSAVTGANWEGVGVCPDVPVGRDHALPTAQIAALEAILAPVEGDTSRPARLLADEARAALSELQR